MLWISDILVVRICESVPLTSGSVSAPDPTIFVYDLQDANEKLFFLRFCAYYLLLKEHLHNFYKIKSHKEVGIKVFLIIFA